MTKPLDLKHIAFADLHISTLNMRHKAKGNKPPDISDILPSVKQRGIRQPLLVRPEPTKDNKNAYGIIAGRRRYFCLKTIADDGVKLAPVPCCIMDADDDAEGLEASILENIARLAPTAMEQYEAFKTLADKGVVNQMVADIAGKTTAQGCVTDTAKNQKQIIKNRMAGHGVDKANPDWLPRWAAFPAIYYREENGCPPAQNWKRIAQLFTKRTAKAKPTPRKQAA